MPFFIRKSFSSGPVRLNLSKGGLGVSAGITGARIGVNRRGSYVYGGRHGLYYRESLNKKRNSSSETINEITQTGDKVEIFEDTGNTFDKFFNGTISYPNPAGSVPSVLKILIAPTFFLSFGLLILFYTFEVGLIGNFWYAPTLLAIVYSFFALSTKSKMSSKIKAVSEKIEETDNLSIVQELLEWSPALIYKNFYQTAIAVIGLKQIADHYEKFSKDDAKSFLLKIDLNENQKTVCKKFVLNQVYEDFVEDMALSETQENILRNIISLFEISDEDIPDIISAMDALTDIRNAIDSKNEPIETDINLLRGESCFYTTDVRLLKKRVFRTRQIDGVKYNFTGYDIKMEGKIYLTDRRLLIIDNGSREYRYNKIFDTILSLEDNTVSLIISGRANPVILTAPNSAILAGKLENLIEHSS